MDSRRIKPCILLTGLLYLNLILRHTQGLLPEMPKKNIPFHFLMLKALVAAEA